MSDYVEHPYERDLRDLLAYTGVRLEARAFDILANKLLHFNVDIETVRRAIDDLKSAKIYADASTIEHSARRLQKLKQGSKKDDCSLCSGNGIRYYKIDTIEYAASCSCSNGSRLRKIPDYDEVVKRRGVVID